MSTPVTPAPGAVKDDPAKPYKAFVAALATAVLVALASYFTAGNNISWPGLLAALGAALVNFLVTYFTKNPKVVSMNGGPL